MSSFQWPPTAGSGSVSFPLQAPNGGAGAPSYSFSNSVGSGMYLISAGNLGFSGTAAFSGSVTSNSVVLGSSANTISGLATIVNSGTITLPTATDTLVGRNTTDTLTQKTISGASNTLSNIADGSLSTSYVKADGSRALTANWAAGAFTIKASAFISNTLNAAGSGVARLANTESISWRNAANSADLALTVNASNALQFNSVTLADISSAQTLTTKTIDAGSNTISNIANANISGTAAIAYSKLSLTGSIVNADVSASAAIAYSKLSLTGSVVNADISGSAAIAYSKLNLASSIATGDLASGLLVPSTKGGTGVNNAGSLTYGSNNISLTTSGSTSLTLPTSGTVTTFYSGNRGNVSLKTTTYTVLSTDDLLMFDSSGGAYSVTMVGASSVSGKILTLSKKTTDTNTVTINRAGSDVFVYKGTTSTSITLNTFNESYTLWSDGSTNWYVVAHETATGEINTFTFSVTGTGAAVGTGVTSSFTWWRLSNRCYCTFSFTQTGAGTAGSSTYNFGVPFTVDTTNTTNFIGDCYLWDGSTSSEVIGYVSTTGSTNVQLTGGASNSFSLVGSSRYPLSGANVRYRAKFDFPVSGWVP